MKIGMVGLGKMGTNMARRLLARGHHVVAFDKSPDRVDEIVKEGAIGAYALDDLVNKLDPPRVVWMMIPAGKPVAESIALLKELLREGDSLVDGGNSQYRDDIRYAAELKSRGVHYLDAGVSGGIWGFKEGYCLMLGGDEEGWSRLAPILEALAPKDGYLYCGPSGAGHFVKMIHNGIEYGMMAAYGEGFEILKASPYGRGMNFQKVAHLWNQGSVIRSWLLELIESALRKDPDLSAIEGYVEDSGEGRWVVKEAIDASVPAPVITAALFHRFRSRQNESFADKLAAALRNEFGGHAVKKRGEG